MNKKSGLVLLLIFVFMILAKADVAPDPDEMRMSADLIIETTEDLSDYRFFVDFFGAVHEVEIKSKAQTAIPPLGGGARYSSGNLLAISKKNLKDYPEKIASPYAEEGKNLSQAISQKKIEGIIELGKHQFSSTIKISQRKNWTYPTYKLERAENSLKLVKLRDISPKISDEEESKMQGNRGSNDSALYGISKSLTPIGYLVIVGFPTAAIIILGIWLFRRRKLG